MGEHIEETKGKCAICGKAIGKEPAIWDDEGNYIHMDCIWGM